MNNLYKIDPITLLLGRVLIALYFIGPGIFKIIDYSGYLSLMALKGVPLPKIALPITIFCQIVLSVFIIINKHLRVSALILFVLTMLINIFIHDFWNLGGDPSQAHETQNFVKNLGIAAGLLVLSSKEK
jgi:putative oxidoreductase